MPKPVKSSLRPKLVTLNVAPETKEAVVAYKVRPFAHSEDEALQRVLHLAKTHKDLLTWLKEYHPGFYDQIRLKFILNGNE